MPVSCWPVFLCRFGIQDSAEPASNDRRAEDLSYMKIDKTVFTLQIEFFPICTPHNITEFAPIQTLSSITTGLLNSAVLYLNSGSKG